MDWLEIVNLAPLFYRNILEQDGGPINEIIVSKAEITQSRNGFEAACFLSKSLTIDFSNEKNYIYGNPDGSGSDIYKSQAIYKSISEALERWAFFSVVNSKTADQFGFDLDSSTNGMAAYPCVFTNKVKKIAFLEALERWALIEWWAGNLATQWGTEKNISYIKIMFNTNVVVICWCDISNKNNKKAYGFAADVNFNSAFAKAQIELFRNIFVLEKFFKDNNDIQINGMDLGIYEKRLLWFASFEGFSLFKSKVDFSNKLKSNLINPKLIVNKEIVGPWTKYARVWRCLFESTASYNRSNKVDQFLF